MKRPPSARDCVLCVLNAICTSVLVNIRLTQNLGSHRKQPTPLKYTILQRPVSLSPWYIDRP